jgi:hypothetical protein
MKKLYSIIWLQHVSPNHHPGGDGTPCDPAIKWWLDHISSKLTVFQNIS